MTRLICATCIATLLLCSFAQTAFAQTAAPQARLPDKQRTFLKTHCFDCHDSATQEGKVDLEKLPLDITNIEQAERWQKVLNALNACEMPPEDSEQPGNTEKADFLDALAQTMVAARRALSDSGGKITMRRLNRREYQNTIEHLLGIRVDVASLPTDGGSGTFDTVGASQFISSDQIEQYLKIGGSAIDELFERKATLAQEAKVFRVEPEKTINPANEKQIAVIEDAYARFTRWQKGVDKAKATPENQARMAEFRKTEVKAAHPVWSYGYADRLEGTPNPKDFGFGDSKKAAASHPENDRANLAYHKHYAALPHRDRGTYLKLAHGTGRVIVAPKELPAGNYTLRVRAGAVNGSPASRHFIQLGHPQRQIAIRNWGLEGRAISTHQVNGTIESPETIEIPLEVGAKTTREFAIQEKQPNNGNLKALWDAHSKLKEENGYGHPPAIWIDWVELEGPLHEAPATGTQSPLQVILAKHSGNPKRERGIASGTGKSLSLADASGYQEDPRAILTEFAKSAFRDVSPESDYIDRLVRIFQTRRAAGDSFDVAIRTPLSVILASPGFVYLYEPAGENAPQKPRNWTNTVGKTMSAELIALEGDTATLRRNGREYRVPLSALSEVDRDYARQWDKESVIQSRPRTLTDRELAVRLAYFLWSSPPDSQLLKLAKHQKLSQPEILRQQVDRLITDSRSDEFVSGFVHQWLDMERLDFFQFDTTLHHEFDESTRSAARQEVYHSFAHLLRTAEAGHLGKLLKSDHVFVNGLLANYYGIDGVTGDQFQQVSLPKDSPRGGLLGMAAIHAMGSDGIESSPVERGAWVLRYILNDPPPPAPPNVPQLSRLADKPLTTREKLAAHQEEAQCASCHRKIDPIGFGLENFNAAGKWRAEERQYTKSRKGKVVLSKKGSPIDISGKFHNGPAFADYHEMRELIAEREDDFARGFTEHLIEYALGRPFGFTDEGLANEILVASKDKQYAVSEFIHALVQSRPFQSK